MIGLIALSGCAKETSQDTKEGNAEDLGYVNDIDQEIDTSDTNSLDEDLNMDWV